MVEIKWTDNALKELDNIANFISKDSPKYAQIFYKECKFTKIYET